MFDWLWQWLVAFGHWLYEVIVWIPKVVWKWLLEALAAAITALPVPDWIANAGNMFASIPSGVAYFLAFAQFGTGFAIIISAYLIRFGIRRLPVVG